jgi:hypothetical protein
MAILSLYIFGFIVLSFLTYLALYCKKRIEYNKLISSLSVVPSNITIATQVNIEPGSVIIQLPDPELLVLPVINE